MPIILSYGQVTYGMQGIGCPAGVLIAKFCLLGAKKIGKYVFSVTRCICPSLTFRNFPVAHIALFCVVRHSLRQPTQTMF